MSLFKKSVKPSSDFQRKLGVDEPLFILPNGRKVYSVLGASPDGDPDNEGDPNDDDTDDDDNPDDDPDDSDKDDKDNQKDKDKSDTVSREEYNRILRRMQAADRNRQAAEDKVKEFTDKDKSELERATELADGLKTENESLTALIRDLRIEKAFLISNQYTWHDPEDVLVAVKGELDKIDISDDGVVDKKSLKSVLDDIAKRKPHWIKPVNGGNGSSGEPGPGRSNNHKDDKAKRKDLEDKFPALRRLRK